MASAESPHRAKTCQTLQAIPHSTPHRLLVLIHHFVMVLATHTSTGSLV